MRCSCGSTRFIPLGIQETAHQENPEKPGKAVHLINCAECGTTLSCSKHFYSVVKYLYQYQQVESEFDSAVKLAH